MWSKPMTPSQGSCHTDEDLSTFLSNKEFRKLYNNLLGVTKKYQNSSANNWFLGQCISESVVPKTFRISNQPHARNKEFSARWTSASKSASIEWMKITLKEDQSREIMLLEDVANKFNGLCAFGNNETIFEQLKARVKYKGINFKNEAMDEKKAKFERLVKESSHATSAYDDQQKESG